MTAKDVLGLVIRIAALAMASHGIYSIYYALVEAAGYTPSAQHSSVYHATFGFIRFVVALVIIRIADHIVNFCYGSRKQ